MISYKKGLAFNFLILLVWLNFNQIWSGKIEIIKEAIMDIENIKYVNGYKIEKHSVITQDGYQLILHRIPYGKSNSNFSKPTGVPVLIMHSWMCNSLSWIDNLEDSLADQLFDVWLGNVRGNEGTNHKTYGRSEAKFWDYSWEEMAEDDLPAIIDYIRNVTEYKKILYIGHSLGSLIGFGLLSAKPEFNNKVAGFIALGPLLSGHYVTGLVIKLLAVNFDNIQFYLEKLQISEIRIIPQKLKKISLGAVPFVGAWPTFMTTIFGGFGSQFYNMSRFAVYVRDCTESTSFRTFVHFAQLKRLPNMSKFDYGKDKNLITYNELEPPEYNTTNINVPIALFSSANDPLSTPIDVQLTARKLRNVIVNEIVPDVMFNHINYMWSHPSRTLLNDRIIYLLKQMWDVSMAV